MLWSATTRGLIPAVALSAVFLCSASCAPGDPGGEGSIERFDALPVLTFDLEEFPHTFSMVTGAAAARGGPILADRREHLVARLNFESGAVDTVGREGSGGPGEYTAPGGLFLLAGDTLVVREDRRWIVFDPDGVHVDTWVPEWIGRVGTGTVAGSPHGADVFVSGVLTGSITADTDFHELARWTPSTGLLETVDSVARAPRQYIALPGTGGTSRFAAAHPFGARDRWAPAGDGGLVIARGASSAVEFLDRTGRRVRTFPLPEGVPSIPLSAEDRAAHDHDPRFEWDWPEYKPFFGDGGIVVDLHSGVAWIPVSEARGSATRYYLLVDPEEGPIARARFPAGFTLRAMGHGFGYGVRADEATGLQRIFRFGSEP